MRARPLVRRAAPVVVAGAAVAALVAGVRPRPQALPLPERGQRTPPPIQITPGSGAPEPRRVSSRRPRRKGPVRSATGDPVSSPFSYLAVRVTFTGDELTRVETVDISGTGARTQAINARAEPILREEALRAGSAKIDVVTGATYTSRSYIQSLQSAIDRARRG